MIEQTKFNYSPLGKVFEKQIKAIEEQGRNWVESIEEQGKQLVKSNAFVEREGKSIPLNKQK